MSVSPAPIGGWSDAETQSVPDDSHSQFQRVPSHLADIIPIHSQFVDLDATAVMEAVEWDPTQFTPTVGAVTEEGSGADDPEPVSQPGDTPATPPTTDPGELAPSPAVPLPAVALFMSLAGAAVLVFMAMSFGLGLVGWAGTAAGWGFCSWGLCAAERSSLRRRALP